MMFELIRANKRRSMILVIVVLFVLMALGFAIGSAVIPSVGATEYRGDGAQVNFAFDPTGGIIGMVAAGVIWFFQSIIAYFQGDRILLRASRAQPIEKSDHPQLFNVVEEMTIAAQLPKMPRIYIINDMSLNAFATGRQPENASVAVTAGLLGRLNRDQLQGVVAHEISHIVHRDVLFMSMVGIMLGTILILSETFLRSLWYGAGTTGRYRSSSRRGNNGAQGVIMIIAIILAILAPILAQMIYFAVSRRREYLADAGAAVYTRYPEGLASALEVLANDTHVLASASRATAPMYIINPLHKEGAMALNLTQTHPPIRDRIKILRGMSGNVSYKQYQNAWNKVSGGAQMPAEALAAGAAPIRTPHPDALKQAQERKTDQRQRMREAGDLLRNVNQYIFLPCVCGIRVKLPPDFKREHIQCPRCHRDLRVPVAELAAATAVGDQLTGKEQPLPRRGTPPTVDGRGRQTPLEVTRRGKGWMSCKCPCGAVKNIAPSFMAERTNCSGCGREIRIKKG